MSITEQPKLLLAIYALLGVLAMIFIALLCSNPLNFESLPATKTATMLTQAELLRTKGQADQSEKICLNALKLIEGSDDDMQKAQVYRALGQSYSQEKKPDEAQDAFRKALACLDRQIDMEGSQRLSLENLRRAQQQHALIEGDLGDLFVALSRYQEAEACYKAARGRNDQYLGTLDTKRSLDSRLAAVLAKAGKNNEAGTLQVEQYASDYASKDLMMEIKRVQDQFHRGEIDSREQVIQLKAIALSAQRKSRKVPYVDARTALAKALLESGHAAEAKTELISVFDFVKKGHFEPDEETIWLGRARVVEAVCDLALNDEKAAQKMIDEAGTLNPKLLFMCMQMHFQTQNLRAVEFKNYSALLLHLADMAHLETYQRKNLDADSLSDLAVLYNNIGTLYATLNEDEKANHYFKSALLLAERLKNPGLQAEVSTRSGRIALKQKKYTEAQRFFEHSNAIQSSIKIDNEQAIRLINQSISENYCDIARVFEAQKDEAKVRAYYKLAYEHDIPYHNWMGMVNYAQFLQSRGDYKGARTIYEKSLANLRTVPDMPKYFEDLLQNRLRRLPNIKGDPAVDALIEEGRKRVSEKNIDIARATFQKAINAAVEKFGRDSIESAQVYRNIADCYMSAHYEADAEPLYKSALEIAERVKVNFPRLDYIRYCLCLQKEKDENKIENAKTIISILKPVNTEIEADGDHLDKPYLSTSELLIADAYSTQSMFAEAQDYFNRAVSAAEYEMTVNPADYVQCQLAEALRAQAINQAKLKNFDGAAAGFKRAIEIWQKVKSKPVVVKNLTDTRIMLNEANSQKSGGG